MAAARYVRIFRNGVNQAVRIPRDLELPGKEALMWKDGRRLVIEPVRQRSLRAVLEGLKKLDDEFPSLDDPPPEPVDL